MIENCTLYTWKAPIIKIHMPVRYGNASMAFIQRGVSDSISQDILSQIYDVIQSDVALHLQVH